MAYDPRTENLALFKRAVLRTFDFKGRSRRAELVIYYLGSMFAAVVILMVLRFGTSAHAKELQLAFLQIETGIQGIILIPMIALLVRRLHDQGKSGWWALPPLGMFSIAWGYHWWTGNNLETLFHPVFLGVIVLGTIAALFYIALAPGQNGENVYGSDPHYDVIPV